MQFWPNEFLQIRKVQTTTMLNTLLKKVSFEGTKMRLVSAFLTHRGDLQKHPVEHYV